MVPTALRVPRVLAALLLVPVSLALCGASIFGLLATLEPMPPERQWFWRGVYVALGLTGLALMAFALLRGRSSDSPRK